MNFISSKDAEEERVMYSNSNNIKFPSCNDPYQVVDELIDSINSRYQGNLEKSIKESQLIFVLAQLMYYKCHRVNFRRSGSYIGSAECIKKKKATMNPKNKDD